MSTPIPEDHKLSKFPSAGTLRAEVLAVLLASENMAGLDSVFTGTHRLSTVIRALTRRYGWPIERHDFATNTVDGRAVWVTAYALPAETIAKALEHGAARWVEEVKAARRDRRQQASKRQYRFTPKDVIQLINSNIYPVKGNTP